MAPDSPGFRLPPFAERVTGFAPGRTIDLPTPYGERPVAPVGRPLSYRTAQPSNLRTALAELVARVCGAGVAEREPARPPRGERVGRAGIGALPGAASAAREERVCGAGGVVPPGRS